MISTTMHYRHEELEKPQGYYLGDFPIDLENPEDTILIATAEGVWDAMMGNGFNTIYPILSDEFAAYAEGFLLQCPDCLRAKAAQDVINEKTDGLKQVELGSSDFETYSLSYCEFLRKKQEFLIDWF